MNNLKSRLYWLTILNHNTLNNLEEMSKFLEKYNLPKLNKKEINNLKRPINSSEIESAVKKFPTK